MVSAVTERVAQAQAPSSSEPSDSVITNGHMGEAAAVPFAPQAPASAPATAGKSLTDAELKAQARTIVDDAFVYFDLVMHDDAGANKDLLGAFLRENGLTVTDRNLDVMSATI